MRKSKYPQVPAPGTEPVAPPKGKPRKPPKPHGPHDEKPPKKKKRKRHLFLWIVVLVLLIGILIGLLIDRGLLFPGGEGWIGGLVGQETGGKQSPTETVIDLNGTITPNPTIVPTTAIVEGSPNVYIKVSGDKIYMNGVEVTPNDLIAQLHTPTYKDSTIYITNENATKTFMDNLRTLLRNEHRNIIE